MGYYCNECRRKISDAEYSYSTKYFEKPLCRGCQTKKRNVGARGFRSTGSFPKKQRHPREEVELDVLAGVQKIVGKVGQVIKEMPIKKGADFNRWIADWRKTKRLAFSMESKHFFLGGTDLDEFTKEIIKMAEKTILIANPYLESCYLTDLLVDSAIKNTKIGIVTRQPEMKEIKKAQCHSKLRKVGISLRYDSQIHSKIIVADDKVAIASSMNFYSGSSGGASKEAGIVSIDEGVVESATNYIKRLIEAP